MPPHPGNSFNGSVFYFVFSLKLHVDILQLDFTVFCMQGLQDVAVKMRHSVKKEIIKTLEQYTSNVKFYVADQQQEVFNLLRSVS